MRKTIEIETLKKYVNRELRGCNSVDYRLRLCALIETMLHSVHSYKGFAYLNGTQVPDGCEPGIVWDHEARQALAYPDETRRAYL